MYQAQDAQIPLDSLTMVVGFALWEGTGVFLTAWYLFYATFYFTRGLLIIAKIDFRETAPAASDTLMYVNSADPTASTIGGLGLFIFPLLTPMNDTGL